MAPYEALYGRKCRSPVCGEEVGERKLSGAEIIQITSEKLGTFVFLRVSPMKDVVRFGVKGKLATRYVEPYEIIERVGAVDYCFALPPDMSLVHTVFHVSMLRKSISDPSHVHKLRNKEISLVEIMWRNHSVEDCT
ncbi:uncharacterized protein LOC126665872 [Mercurialis annua]|uniref:uncharacterized protein LOC126665872 n=1 Tax=Mercurialis annua TaxID=3986 RepID=UPI00215E1381|nr:uncharacterized protein LOC126665872 [Mercurialis annua]